MYLYVLRHGQTDWNKDGRLLSTTDIPLNDTGIKQCKEAEKIIKNLDYDLVICSPLLRAKQTAQIVNTKNIEVIYDERIVERDARSLEGVDVDQIDYKRFWIYGKEKLKDEETIDECKARVYDFLNEIRQKYSNKNILIVTHNGVCRMIYTYFNGFPKNGNLYNNGHENAQLKMYDLK